MTITEIRKDLFNISNNEYYYVHCISADYALGAGIAKIFRDRFNMRKKLENSFPIIRYTKLCFVAKPSILSRKNDTGKNQHTSHCKKH